MRALADMQPAQVRGIGSELQGDGSRIGQFGAGVAEAGILLRQALSGTPLAEQEQGLSSGMSQVQESMGKYHDYLTAYGQSLIAAADSYQKADERHGHAFAPVEDEIGWAAAAPIMPASAARDDGEREVAR